MIWLLQEPGHQQACYWPSYRVNEYYVFYSARVNSLAPGRSGFDSKNGIFNLVLLIGIFRSSHDNALQWMPQDVTDDESTLVQVMAWCHQATSHYLSQCWLSSLSPYAIVRPQWVKIRSTSSRFLSCLHAKCVCASGGSTKDPLNASILRLLMNTMQASHVLTL